MNNYLQKIIIFTIIIVSIIMDSIDTLTFDMLYIIDLNSLHPATQKRHILLNSMFYIQLAEAPMLPRSFVLQVVPRLNQHWSPKSWIYYQSLFQHVSAVCPHRCWNRYKLE